MNDPGIFLAASAWRLPRREMTIQQITAGQEDSVEELRRALKETPKLPALGLEEVGSVHVFESEPPGSLALECAREVRKAAGAEKRCPGLIVDFSTASRAKNGLTGAYEIQAALGADGGAVLAIGNGSCVSFLLALKCASNWMSQDDSIIDALLFAEDRVVGNRLHPGLHVLGDGASALWLSRERGRVRLIDVEHLALGRYHRILGVDHASKDNFQPAEFLNYVTPIHYRAVHDVVNRLLRKQRLALADIDSVVYQNMSQNDYDGLAGALEISREKICSAGLAGHGHIFGSDLVINFDRSQRDGLLPEQGYVLMISSGAGFSWAAALLETIPQPEN